MSLYNKIMNDYITELRQNHDFMTSGNGIKEQLITSKYPELNSEDVHYVFLKIKYGDDV